MKVVFLRHGESKANVWNKMYDDEDMNFLSLRGAKQADLASYTVADLMMPHGIDHVYTSMSVRARQTGSIVMQGIGDWQRPYNKDERLNEWCYGCPAHLNWWEWEPEESFRIRIRSFFDDAILPLWDTEATMLIVSHYYTMVGLFDEIGSKRNPLYGYVPLDPHGEVKIPNAIPFWFDTESGKGPEMVLPGTKAKKR